MSTETSESSIIKYDGSIKQDSPDPASEVDRTNELSSITEIQCYLQKYSTTSSVFAEQSISNPDYQRTLFCISCILQAELFDDLKDAEKGAQMNPELLIMTALPPHLGGPVDVVADELLDRETMDDPELRAEIIAGTVPTVDTILRFISWLHQSAKYSAQCNIIAFIYIKRMMDAKNILTMENWRGMWLGSIILAQKIWDDASLRTSSFASILPGVTKAELKGLEFKIFTLLNYCTTVKPSVFARFYFELREIFKSITGEFRDASVRGPRRRPLTIKNGIVLNQCVDELSGPTAYSKSTSRRGSSRGSSAAAGTNTASSSLPPTVSPSKASQDRDSNSSCSTSASKSSQQQHSAQKLPAIKASPSLTTSRSFRAVDDGAGTSGRDGEQQDNSMLCSHPLSSAPPTPGGARGHDYTGSSSSSKSSSRAPRFTFKPSKPSPKTLEDFDYVNPSIFVLS